MRPLALLLLLALAACAAPPPVPPVPPVTPVTPSATLLPVPPVPPVTPSATLPPSSQPTLTPTPGLPQGRITPDTLGGLGLLRAIGYGYPRAAAFVGADRLALGTSAGLLWLDLPGMRPGRFDALPGGVSALASSPDGRLLAVSDAAGRASAIVRSADGVTLATVQGGVPTFSPDGRLVASWDASDPAVTTVWRTDDGAQLSVLRGVAPVFSPDGTLAVTHDSSATALLTRSGGGGYLADLGGSADVAFSPDGALLATVGLDGLRLFTVNGAELGAPRLLSADRLHERIAFSADGARLLAQDTLGNLRAWSVPGGEELGATPIASGSGLRFGPQGHLLETISAGGDGPERIEVSRTSDGRLVYSDPAPAPGFTVFSPDGARAAVVKYDGSLYLIDAGGYAAAARPLRGYSQIAFSADGSMLAASADGPQVDLWHAGGDALLAQWGSWSGFDRVDRVGFSPDGSQVIVALRQDSIAGVGSSLQFRGLSVAGAGERELARVTLERADDSGALLALPFALSQPGGRAAWIDSAGRMRLLDVGDAGTLLDLAGPYGAISFSPDGALLAAAQDAGGIRIFRAADGGDVAAIDAERPVEQLVFSPDGALLAARSADGATSVFRLADGARLAEIGLGWKIDDRAPALQIAADGSMLAAGDVNGVAFYALPGGRELRRIEVRAEGLALGPGQRLLAVLSDGRVSLWGVP